MPIAQVNLVDQHFPRDGQRKTTAQAVATADVVLFLGVPRHGVGVTAIPGAGGSMKIFRSTSLDTSIAADVANGTLSSANLAAGTQPTLSRWMLWTSGSVTAATNETAPLSAGDTAIAAIAVTAAGAIEVAY